LQQALAERPHAEAWMDLGQVYLHQKQFGPATAALETAARMSPQSASVQADLGDAYAWSGTQTAKAQPHYQQALALSTGRLKVDPQDLNALMIAAYCAASLGERQPALAWLNAALQHAPEDAEVNYYAARVYARLGDQAAARQWAETAIAHGYSKADVMSAPDLQGVAPAK
ncbi:MAG: tetratricopeptide repeat protein, partial [Acidobacteriaceae bacterium]